jgi:TolB-like protein
LSVFDELKRRNVYRAGAAYVVISWLIIQVAETILPAFGFGDSAIRTIIIILSIGFVPVLVSAWAFELTLNGLIRESEIDRTSPSFKKMDKRVDRLIMVVLALAVGYFLYDRVVLLPQREAQIEKIAHQAGGEEALAEALAARTDRSLVVLPFVDMSQNQDQEFFADGLAEELMTLLARMPELRVISRTSAFAFTDKVIEVPDIARQLNVAHVLEGSVRVDGNRIRITAQLINARDDEHLWARNFDRELADVFAIQDEVATLVVRELKVNLLGEPPMVRRTDPEAYALYLQAQIEVLTEENVASSIENLKQALTIDSEYAPAWVRLSGYYFTRFMNFKSDKATLDLAFSAVNKALRLDPYYAPAHTMMGKLTAYKNDLQSSARHFERAFEIDPTNELVFINTQSLLQSLGRFDEAEQILRFALDRDPLSAVIPSELALVLLMAKRPEEAESLWRRVLYLNPDGPAWVPVFFAFTLASNGKLQEALKVTQDMAEGIYQSWTLIFLYQQLGMTQEYEAGLAEMKLLEGNKPNVDFASLYALLGDADEAFARLDLVDDFTHWSRERYWPMYWFIEDDPRWEKFLERAGVSDAQLSEIEFNFSMPQKF